MSFDLWETGGGSKGRRSKKYSLMRRSKGSNFASLREDYCLFNFGSILIFYLI